MFRLSGQMDYNTLGVSISFLKSVMCYELCIFIVFAKGLTVISMFLWLWQFGLQRLNYTFLSSFFFSQFLPSSPVPMQDLN